MTKEESRITGEDLKRMSQIDPRTVDTDSLVDIHDVKIRSELGQDDRIRDYIHQIKNPYCYLDNGMVVKISFSGKKRLEDCLMDCILSE